MIARLGKLLNLIILILVVVASVIFAVLFYQQNEATVSLHLLEWSTSEQPVWIWLLISLTIGFGLGMLAMGGMSARLAWRARNAERAQNSLAVELAEQPTSAN